MSISSMARAVGPARLSIPLRERLIVALDVPTVERARELISALGSDVVFYKIGIQLQFGGGLQLAKELNDEGKKVFLDSKLLDIYESVAGAVRHVANLGVDFLTIHSNGAAMQAAVSARGDSHLKILAVTVLTSLDQDDLREIGEDGTVEELVLRRARKAQKAGCDGVIVSGHEARQVREAVGDQFIIVVPGIRSPGVPADDQKRTATPADAIRAGADHIVVGRQITRSPSPQAEVHRILGDIEGALT